MAPSRKSRSVNKRFSYMNEAASNKYGENANKTGQKKRKLSDMLGPQWTKEELENFYEAYRKYGKDWKKVASVVRHRSVEMVEALYSMNKAYLSLPEGVASVVGLIAMMTDHYCILGGSDSEQENNEDAETSRKPQKHARSKLRSESSKGLEGHIPDFSESHPMASTSDCLSLLKNRRSGIRPHAVKKRTPRVPVAYSNDQDNSRKYSSPARQGLKLNADANNNDVAHEIALALTEASHRGGSPLVSWTPKRKAKGTTPSPVRNGERMCAESEMTNARLHGCEMDEGGCELSLGSTEADNDYYDINEKYAMGREGTGTLEVQQRRKRYFVKKKEVDESKNKHVEDIKEACSGTEEGQKLVAIKGKLDTKVVKSARSFYKDTRKKSKKALIGGDEGSPFDALQTLADLSLMMPEAADTESSAHVKEDNFNIANKSKLKGSRPIPGVEHAAFKTSKLGKLGEGVHQSNSGLQKGKQKSLSFKIYNEAQTDCYASDNEKIEATVEVKKSASKGKRSSHYTTHPKQGKLVKKTLWNASSTTDHKREENDSGLSTVQVPSANPANLPTKNKGKWEDMQKSSIQKDTKSPESILDDQPDRLVPSFCNRELNIKEKLSSCLSRYQVRRWCAFEWFYSAIDYPWFAKREFVEYLDHVGLGHVPRLTRVEWGVIRSSLGRPRRFSEQFLKEEKEKLNQYRESVRTHYAELNAGTREGLPTDLARPLSVGQHVIAFHPRAREIHNGIVLTVDHSRCSVQFDQPELGVEYIMDVDCMPLHPAENLPASFRKHNVTVNKYIENLKELKINEQLKEGTTKGYMKISSSDKLVKSSSFNVQAKVGPGETASTQVANYQPSIPAQTQAKEADVQAIYELTRALDKKEAVVSELRRMNDEVFENQRDEDNSIRDSEPFKKEYAAVLLQLSQVNDQVSSALLCLRQRNTYRGSSPHTVVKPMDNLSGPGSHSNSYGYSCDVQESASHMREIVESSRAKAHKMVDAAMQAFSSLRKENNFDKIEEVIDFVSNRFSDDAGMLAMGSSTTPADPIPFSQDQLTSCTSKPLATGCAHDPPKSNNLSNQSEEKLLSDLIVNCVAAFMMIQTCTARQFPPADVAQVLDHAVTSLQPFCPQNLSVYGEIQKCMGIIRNQIMALVPTCEISFTDNSSWTRSRRFRLGARVLDKFDGTRIKEAKTESFIVRDHRGELYKKHHPPSLLDEVWRLEKIGKDGAFHKRLSRENINTVKDFLTLLFIDPSRLRNILGTGMSAKMWEVTVEHAQTCILDKRMYLYCPPSSQQRTGVVFNIVGQVMGLLLECEYIPISKLSEAQKADGQKLVISAFEHWEEVIPFDDEASLRGASSNFTSALHASSSPRADDPDGSKFLASQKVGGFDYPHPSVSSPDIISSIYSVGSTSGLDDYALHNIDGLGLRYDQTLSFPGQVTNSLICDTDPMAHALFDEDNLQFFDADLHSQNIISESQADLQSAVDGFLLTRSTAVAISDKAQRRWTKLFSVLKWFSIRRSVALKRSRVREIQRY